MVVSAPLNFELKKLNPKHEYLADRGFSTETVEHFGAGYCNRGIMKGRIAIPLKNSVGDLIGYAGRLADDSAIDSDHPKYMFPGKREHDGKRHEFHKSDILYNSEFLNHEQPCQDLIIVEGFTDVWWLWQNGFKNVAAVLGSSCSDKQAEHISMHTHYNGGVWIMTDGDKAGKRCAVDILSRVGSCHH